MKLDRLTGYRKRWGVVRASPWPYDRVDGTTWTSTGTIPNVTLAELAAFPMFETAGLELTWTETTPGLITAVSGEIRRQGSNRVRDLPTMYPARPAAPSGASGGGDPFAGCTAPYLAEGGAYQARFTITDGTNTATKVITWTNQSLATRLPNWGATPTHYISPSGSDSNNGTSAATPWRSWDKMVLSAPTNAIVRVAPGRYVGSTRIRTLPLTIVALNPATGESVVSHLGESTLEIVEANAGSRSVVEPSANIDHGPAVSAPTGATDTDLQTGAITDNGTITVNRIGPWQQVTITGEELGGSHTVWRWLSCPMSFADNMCWSTTRGGATTSVANWMYETGTDGINSKERFAERLYLNDGYNYGFWYDGSAGAVGTQNRDVYLRLPGDVNPNTVYITLHGIVGSLYWMLNANGPDIAVHGVEFRNGRVAIRTPGSAVNVVIQRCLFREGLSPINDNHLSATNVFSTGLLIYRNLFTYGGLYQDVPDATTIPWWYFKNQVFKPDHVTAWSTVNVGSRNESTAIGTQGGSQSCLIQENTVRGHCNGFSSVNGGYNGEAARDRTIVRNLFIGIADDPIEPEGNGKRWAVYGNKTLHTLTGVAFAPFNYGPLTMWENAHYDAGWRALDGNGRGPTGLVYKFSAADQWASCMVHIVNCAAWSNRYRVGGASGAQGGGTYNTTQQYNKWRMHNSLIRVGDAASGGGNTFEIGQYSDDNLVWVENNNVFAQAYAGTGLTVRRPGTNGSSGTPAAYRTLADLTTYRTNNGTSGTQTNKLGGTDFSFEDVSIIDTRWSGASAGDLRSTHADFIRTGVRVRGFHFASNVLPNRGYHP